MRPPLVQGKLITKFPVRVFVGLGLFMVACRAVVLTRIGVHSSYWAWMLAGMALIGLGVSTAVIVGIDLSSQGVAPADGGIAVPW